MSKPIKKQNTSIDEQARRDFDISRDDYALCSYVQFRIADPRGKKAGWCCDHKEEIADWVGISRPGLYKMMDRLSKLNLIEIDAATGFLRVTVEWIEVIGDGKNKRVNKVDSVNKVDTDCKQSLHKTVNKVTPNIEVKSDNKIDESDIKEKEYTPEIDEAINAHFNLKAGKEIPPIPAPPPIDTVTQAADIAIRFVQTNLPTFQKWHEDQFSFMPETPQMMRNSIEAFFSHWQSIQEETGRAYKEPEKWFILKYRTWIATGNKLARHHEAEQQQRQRAATKQTQQRRATSSASQINDFR